MSRQCFARRLFLLPVILGNDSACSVAWLARTSIVTCILVISAATGFAQPFTLSRTFDDPTPTDWDYFGQSVALDGDRILIGSPFDDTKGANVGQAHLFDATTGELLVTFDNPTPYPVPDFGQSEFFGSLGSVALDGNRVLIGAPWANTNGSKVGQAYLFDAETGGLLHTFNDPTVISGDRFGHSVALDGNHILISAIGDDTNGDFTGQVHLFDATSGALLQTFDDPTPSENGAFGVSVAIDGTRVLIGASEDHRRPGEFIGQAYLFDVSGSLLQTFDNPSPADGDGFGNFGALDGNFVLIGDPYDDTNGENVGQAHLFDATTGDLLLTFDDPTPSTTPGFNVGDRFGGSLAVDGNFVLIGAPDDDSYGVNVGQAHLFDATTGSLLQTFDDPTPTSVAVDPGCCFVGDRFGRAVALDGNRVLIGAVQDDTNGENVGQAHLFTAITEPSADFDEDGDVDGNDYLKWQRGESPNPLSASDLAAWQLNFGTSRTLASSTAIPEPSAIAMAVGCLIRLARRPCQRRELMS